MQQVKKDKDSFIPTLRLSIIKDCNGLCPFCHKEGQTGQCSSSHMSLSFVTNEVIPAIKKLRINKVILTGGEPSLHSELPDIAHAIKSSFPDIYMGMTTNGECKERIAESIEYLDKITISLSSYRQEVYMKHTRVEPYSLVSFINDCCPKSKAASIVITEDNIQDVFQLMLFLSNQGFDIKLQFVIGQTSITQKQQYDFYKKLCSHYGESQIVLSSTPSLLWNATTNSTIRLKMADLNKFVYDNLERRKACSDCQNRDKCVERGCAIRVHPNGDVSPCLDNHKLYNEWSFSSNLKKAYEDMEII